MKKLLFISLMFLLVLSTMSFLNISFAKDIVIAKTSGNQPITLMNFVFERQPKFVSINPPDTFSISPSESCDIWYINSSAPSGTKDLWIQVSGEITNYGIARGPDCKDGWYLEVYPDQRVHIASQAGPIGSVNGVVLMVVAVNNSTIKVTSNTGHVEAIKKWGNQVFSVTVNKTLFSQEVSFQLSVSSAQMSLALWGGNYFPFTGYYVRELLDGSIVRVDVWNIPLLAPPKNGQLPVFVDFGKIKVANPSQSTTWGLLKKGGSQ